MTRETVYSASACCTGAGCISCQQNLHHWTSQAKNCPISPIIGISIGGRTSQGTWPTGSSAAAINTCHQYTSDNAMPSHHHTTTYHTSLCLDSGVLQLLCLCSTGCTLASAIAAELAKGHEPLAAVQRAKAWLGEVLQASAPLQIGTGPHRPLNHG